MRLLFCPRLCEPQTHKGGADIGARVPKPSTEPTAPEEAPRRWLDEWLTHGRTVAQGSRTQHTAPWDIRGNGTFFWHIRRKRQKTATDAGNMGRARAPGPRSAQCRPFMAPRKAGSTQTLTSVWPHPQPQLSPCGRTAPRARLPLPPQRPLRTALHFKELQAEPWATLLHKCGSAEHP